MDRKKGKEEGQNCDENVQDGLFIEGWELTDKRENYKKVRENEKKREAVKQIVYSEWVIERGKWNRKGKGIRGGKRESRRGWKKIYMWTLL